MRNMVMILFLSALMLNTSCSATRKTAKSVERLPELTVFAGRFDDLVRDKRYDEARSHVDSLSKVRFWRKTYGLWLSCAKADVSIWQEDFARAEREYMKLYRRNPNNLQILAGIGNVFYNRAVILKTDTQLIIDRKTYQEQENISEEYMRRALPYLEKGRAMKNTGPEDDEYRQRILTMLYSIYYQLGEGARFDEIERELYPK